MTNAKFLAKFAFIYLFILARTCICICICSERALSVSAAADVVSVAVFVSLDCRVFFFLYGANFYCYSTSFPRIFVYVHTLSHTIQICILFVSLLFAKLYCVLFIYFCFLLSATREAFAQQSKRFTRATGLN